MEALDRQTEAASWRFLQTGMSHSQTDRPCGMTIRGTKTKK
jgi:hypothetical protein